MPRPIVIGYVSSPGAQAALMESAELAKLSGAKLVIVFAYEIPAVYGGGETGDYRRTLKEFAENATDEAVERIRDTGVEYEVELVPKRPVDALLEVAKERDAQMIVVGHAGRASADRGDPRLRAAQAPARLHDPDSLRSGEGLT